MKKEVSPRCYRGRGDRSGIKEGDPPPGTGAVQGTRAVKLEVSPPPAAVPRVPDLEARKRKHSDELGMDRTGVIFSNPLSSTCLCKVQKEMHDLLMLAMYLCYV